MNEIEKMRMMKNNDFKQNLIEYLRSVDFTNLDDIQIYDELQALIETLHDYYILDTESYEIAENKISKLWGFKAESEDNQ